MVISIAQLRYYRVQGAIIVEITHLTVFKCICLLLKMFIFIIQYSIIIMPPFSHAHNALYFHCLEMYCPIFLHQLLDELLINIFRVGEGCSCFICNSAMAKKKSWKQLQNFTDTLIQPVCNLVRGNPIYLKFISAIALNMGMIKMEFSYFNNIWLRMQGTS